MKIAFIDVTVTVSYGGIQTAVWQLARILHDMGHDITVFGGEGSIRPELEGRAITVKTFPFTPREKVLDLGNRFRRIWERKSFAKHARQTVIQDDYDWLILTKPFDFFWPGLLPAGSRTRCAFMSGGTSFYPGDRRLAAGIDAWLACSHFNAWQIAQHYKRFPAVMFNGVDVEHFHPARRDEQLRAQLGAGEQDLLLTFAGRLVGWKGLAVAIRAMALLADLPVRLLIIGNGDDRDNLRRLIASEGVEARVCLHDPVPHSELPRYYASSDAGVFPSIADEAFGITIAEAMACAIPAIGSYIGGIPEVIGNEGHAGLLVAPADPASLAGAIRRLAADAGQRRRMGAAARQRIVDNFTWTLSAQRLLDALGRA